MIRVYHPPGRPVPALSEGKFLEVAVHGKEYLLFASSELHRYHNQILAHFLVDQQIPHRWLTSKELQVDYPELRVMGGGRYRLDSAIRTLTLWDESQAYGSFDAHALAKIIAAAGPPWNTYRIVLPDRSI